MDNNNNKLLINKHIFKYGREPKVTTFNTKRNSATFDVDISDNIKFFINKRIVNELTTNVNRYINNIALEENITNITNEIEFDIPKHLNLLSISLSTDETDNQDRIFMNDNFHFTSSIFVSNQNNYPNINNFNVYSFITNKKLFIDNDIILKNKVITVKNDNNLYFNDIKLTNNQYEEIYNNISSWCIDDNNDQYTFSKISINSSNNENYELLVNGNTKITNNLNIDNNLEVDGSGTFNNNLDVSGNITVSNSIYFDSSNNNLYANQNNIYFNGCRLNKCEGDNVIFYLSFDYNTTDLSQLESEIKNELLALNNEIDFTDLEFTFTNVGSPIKIKISIKKR